ncbi:unnamed protein product, partial [Ectocarpus sp. 13 AM-2016]
PALRHPLRVPTANTTTIAPPDIIERLTPNPPTYTLRGLHAEQSLKTLLKTHSLNIILQKRQGERHLLQRGATNTHPCCNSIRGSCDKPVKPSNLTESYRSSFCIRIQQQTCQGAATQLA